MGASFEVEDWGSIRREGGGRGRVIFCEFFIFYFFILIFEGFELYIVQEGVLLWDRSICWLVGGWLSVSGGGYCRGSVVGPGGLQSGFVSLEWMCLRQSDS